MLASPATAAHLSPGYSLSKTSETPLEHHTSVLNLPFFVDGPTHERLMTEPTYLYKVRHPS
jgi:hypothetical protein